MLAAEICLVLPRRQDTHMTPLCCKTAVNVEPKSECALFIHTDETGLKKVLLHLYLTPSLLKVIGRDSVCRCQRHKTVES